MDSSLQLYSRRSRILPSTVDQSSPTEPRSRPQCAQMSTVRSEVESKNPLMLRVLDAWNKALLRVGRLTTVSCAGIIVISFGAGAFDSTITTTVQD